MGTQDSLGVPASPSGSTSQATAIPNASANQPAPADAQRLGKNQPLDANLRSLASNPAVAISVYGVEWAGWCAASALDALAAKCPDGSPCVDCCQSNEPCRREAPSPELPEDLADEMGAAIAAVYRLDELMRGLEIGPDLRDRPPLAFYEIGRRICEQAKAAVQSPEEGAQKKREAFEAWCVQNCYPTSKVANAHDEDGNPVYIDPRTHAAWFAVQDLVGTQA